MRETKYIKDHQRGDADKIRQHGISNEHSFSIDPDVYNIP
jgi:hypothetical protein